MKCNCDLPKLSLVLAIGALGMVFTVTPQADAAVGPFNNMVVFGDSLSDVGNIAFQDGGTYPGTSHNYAPGMFTDGPATTPSTAIIGNYAYQLDNALGFATLTASGSGGTDYAYGGAVTGPSSVYAGVTVMGMNEQVTTFVNSKPSAPADNLYMFWGGANDILNAAQATGATASSIDTAATAAAANIDSQITTLYQNGARDFIWLNLPNLALTPEGSGLPTAADLTSAVDEFNSSVTQDVAAIEGGTLPGAKVDVVDDSSVFTELVASPSKYGFTNVTSGAQGLTNVNPDTYLFWDNLHPTTAADAFLVGQTKPGIASFFSIGTATPEPSSWLFLLVGGIAVGLLARSRRRV